MLLILICSSWACLNNVFIAFCLQSKLTNFHICNLIHVSTNHHDWWLNIFCGVMSSLDKAKPVFELMRNYYNYQICWDWKTFSNDFKKLFWLKMLNMNRNTHTKFKSTMCSTKHTYWLRSWQLCLITYLKIIFGLISVTFAQVDFIIILSFLWFFWLSWLVLP